MEQRAAFAGETTTTSADETRLLGARIGAAAGPGTLVALLGPLGAGKTQLTKGIAEGLGVTTVVNSPTFILMNEHSGRLPLFHADAYRLSDPLEAVEAGVLDERHEAGVTVIEWADRLGAWLPAERLEIELEPVPGRDGERRVRTRAVGADHVRLASQALDGLGRRAASASATASAWAPEAGGAATASAARR